MSLRPDPSRPGLNYTFSKLIQRALALAKDAARMDHADVEPKHLLLGLLRVGECAAFSVLSGLEVDSGEIIGRAERLPGDGDNEGAFAERVSFTHEAKMVLHFALAEARELDSTYVGTEHLLLALLRMEGTIPCRILNLAGVSIEDARAETLRVWESGDDEGAEGQNVADRAMARLLREFVEGSGQTLAEFLRNIGAEENAAWARFPDGTWKTWEDVDWGEHGKEIWSVVLAWENRFDRSS